MSRGGLYFFPAFSVSESHCPESLDHSFVNFSTSNDRDRSLWDIDDEFLSCNDPGSEIFMNDLFCRIEDNKDRFDLMSKMETHGSMDLLLSVFFKNFEKNNFGPMQNIIQYMEDNIILPLSLKDLSVKAGYVPGYFSEIFRENIGIPPIRYLNKRRIELSQELLLTTDLSIKEICSRVGIPDAQYFNRLFRKRTGTSPGLYRRKLTKEQSLFEAKSASTDSQSPSLD